MELFVLTVTSSLIQFCDILIKDGPPTYPIRWGVWRDIRVEFGLALTPFVTGPLFYPQKTNLMKYAVSLFINLRSSHLLYDVRLFLLTLTLSNILAFPLCYDDINTPPRPPKKKRKEGHHICSVAKENGLLDSYYRARLG